MPNQSGQHRSAGPGGNINTFAGSTTYCGAHDSQASGSNLNDSFAPPAVDRQLPDNGESGTQQLDGSQSGSGALSFNRSTSGQVAVENQQIGLINFHNVQFIFYGRHTAVQPSGGGSAHNEAIKHMIIARDEHELLRRLHRTG